LDLRKWTGLELFLENRGGMMADDILESMRRRKVELFGHYEGMNPTLKNLKNLKK
jgi:hypothetical protein